MRGAARWSASPASRAFAGARARAPIRRRRPRRSAISKACASSSPAAASRWSPICPGYIATPMTADNPYRMPFLMAPDKAARLIARAIARRRRFYVLPWQMALVARALRLLPRPLYDAAVRARAAQAARDRRRRRATARDVSAASSTRRSPDGTPRIACLVPSLTELLFALGLGEAVVAPHRFLRPSARGGPAGAEDRRHQGLRPRRAGALRPTHLVVNVDENRREAFDARARVRAARDRHPPCAPDDNLRLYRAVRRDLRPRSARPRRWRRARRGAPELAAAAAALAREHGALPDLAKPWMTVSRATYMSRRSRGPAGTRCRRFRRRAIRRSPSDDAGVAPRPQRILLSTEPYAFRDTRRLAERAQAAAACPSMLVDGEMTSWYGAAGHSPGCTTSRSCGRELAACAAALSALVRLQRHAQAQRHRLVVAVALAGRRVAADEGDDRCRRSAPAPRLNSAQLSSGRSAGTPKRTADPIHVPRVTDALVVVVFVLPAHARERPQPAERPRLPAEAGCQRLRCCWPNAIAVLLVPVLGELAQALFCW